MKKNIISNQKDFNNNPDFKLITKQDKKNNISIQQVKEALKYVQQKPFAQNIKVLVIEEANLLSEEAQNILLKTLEECPDYLQIILTAPNSKSVLSTIKSRCKIKKSQPINIKNVKQTKQITLNEFLKMSLEEKMDFSEKISKQSKEELVQLLQSFIEQNREQVRNYKSNTLENLTNIKNDIETTNVNTRLAFENLSILTE